METVMDLTAQLEKAEAKDRFYVIEATINRLLAPQHYTRPFTYKKKGWGEIVRVETTQDGTPTDMRAPRRKRRRRKGEEEIRVGDCWTFKTTDDSKLKKLFKTTHILIPWGTNFGLFKSSLRRSLGAQRRLRYDSLPLGLIKVYPLWLDVGEAPIDSTKKDRLPEVILETRHTSKGDVMVEVFFDYIENRKVKFFVEIDSECPLNEEKWVALVKTLNTLDIIGPSKRGSITIEKMSKVKLTTEETKKLEKGEPIMPVVY